MENGGFTSITLMKWLKFLLAALNIDGWLNIYYGWLVSVIVLAGFTAHGCGFSRASTNPYFLYFSLLFLVSLFFPTFLTRSLLFPTFLDPG